MSATTICTPAILSAHISAEGDDVAERYVTIDGREVRVGTYADAGALCTPPVSGDTYRRYTITGPAAVMSPPAPGPLDVPDSTDRTGQRRTPLLDDNRAAQIDLDAAAEWDAQRPGSGSWRRPADADGLKPSPMLVRLLVAARDGQLAVRRGNARRVTWRVLVRGVEEPALTRVGQMLAALVSVGAVAAPDPSLREPQPLALLDAGRGVLTRWGMDPEQP